VQRRPSIHRVPRDRAPRRTPAGRARRPAPLLGLLLACFLVAQGVACSSPAPPPAMKVAESYRVGPPDTLLIKILPDPPIEEKATVRPDGMISVQLIGEVEAGGRTLAAIAEEIEERISRFKRNARVTVSLEAAASPTVVIFGQVRAPGVFPLTRRTRVAEAIGLQGGTTIFASKGGIRVVRTDGQRTEVHEVNLRAIQKGDLTTNILLEQGDIVVVPPNVFAKVGFAIQNVIFPFTQIMAPAAAATATAARGGF